MKKPVKILVTMMLSDSQMSRLSEKCQIIQAGWGKTGYRLSEDELCNRISDVDILLVGYEKVTKRVIESAPNLKLIGVSRANPANVEISAANARKIPVLYTPGRNAIAAAEFTIGLLLSQARQISKGDRLLRSGKYLAKTRADLYAENPEEDVIWDIDGDSPYTSLKGVELCGKTLGLIGFGNVASRVAQLAIAFGMNVICYTPSLDEERAKKQGVGIVSLKQLFSESDFISVHCSVTPDTKAILNAEAFSLMKNKPYIINTSRATMIDQEAFLYALENGQISGAALDVFWYEPLPENHPLLKFESVTLTPHLAGATHETPERHSRMLVDDVIAWMEGRVPRNVFNKILLDQ